MTRFEARFSDNEKLIVDDVIDFTQNQIDEIKYIASDYLKDLLRNEKYGKDIVLIDSQKSTVLSVKDSIVKNKTSTELYKQDVIKIGIHSITRILERLGSDTSKVIIGLIDRIIRTNVVNKAQFKGYSTLTYTLRESNDPEDYLISLRFYSVNNVPKALKMITISLKMEQPEKMEIRLTEHQSELAEMLAKLKERLKKD